MKTIILEKAGGVENLIMKDVEQPFAKENEVLAKVKVISINPVDVKVKYSDDDLNMICGDKRPAILGWDIAGTVVSAGDNVTQFETGDAVFGMVNSP